MSLQIIVLIEMMASFLWTTILEIYSLKGACQKLVVPLLIKDQEASEWPALEMIYAASNIS
jgi:hypothetical protein